MGKFNITLHELREAILFAEANGRSEHKTITMQVETNGIGNNIYVSEEWDSKQLDVTEYGAY